jgi:Right handed beta helix region
MRFGRGPRHAAPRSGGPRHVRVAHHAAGRGRASRPPWRSRTATIIGLVLTLVAAVTLSVKAVGTPVPPPAAALLGAWVKGGSGSASDQQAATRQLETAIGRKLAIGHSFVPWGQDLGSVPAMNAAAGRTPLISFGGGDQRAVAAGRYDAYLGRLASAVGAIGRPVLLRYLWTPDSNLQRRYSRSGSPFVAAWRHVHDLFTTKGVQASWVWAPAASVFAGARGGADRYWPGDGYVDWVGAAGFNGAACNGSAWTDFATIFRAFYAWGSATGKPLMVAETGTVEDRADLGRKRAWYLDAAGALARSMPRVRAFVYFDEGGSCDWRPDTSTPSMEGFVGLARDPFFGGTEAPAPPPPTTAPPTTSPPTTRPPTTTSPPTTRPPTTTSPPSASRCVSNGGVPIGTGDNAQNVVNAHGAGTAYLVKAGTHQGNFSVRPKSGDTFCGEPGAVLDGGRSLQFAFSGNVNNVTLDSFTIQNYNPGRQNGAIKPYIRATGWVLRNLTVQKNMYLGVNASDGMKILGGHYNYNEQMGIGGNDGHVIGVTLDGLDADPATYDGPELAFNKLLHDRCDYGGGGAKFDGDNIVVRNVWAHDNDCMGIWFDINAVHNLVEYNKVEDNAAEGIFYEISQDACIRHNVVTNNGHGYRSDWYWSSGIGNAGSFNVEVYGNTLANNFNGIVGIQQTRTDSTPPQHLVDHFYVHNNMVSGSGINGLGIDSGTNFSTRDIVYQNNTSLNGTQSFTRTGTGYQACSLLGFGTN